MWPIPSRNTLRSFCLWRSSSSSGLSAHISNTTLEAVTQHQTTGTHDQKRLHHREHQCTYKTDPTRTHLLNTIIPSPPTITPTSTTAAITTPPPPPPPPLPPPPYTYSPQPLPTHRLTALLTSLAIEATLVFYSRDKTFYHLLLHLFAIALQSVLVR